MSKLSVVLRNFACILWLLAGLKTGGVVGYMSAIASVLFLIAMRLDFTGYED